VDQISKKKISTADQIRQKADFLSYMRDLIVSLQELNMLDEFFQHSQSSEKVVVRKNLESYKLELEKEIKIIHDMKTGAISVPHGVKNIDPSTWYKALIKIDDFLDKGEFKELEEFVDSIPYCMHQDFLQGLCLRLEQAVHIYADFEIKNDVISFLEKLSKRAQVWNPSVNEIIKKSLVRLSQTTISNQTQSMLPYWNRAWPESPGNRLLNEALDNLRRYDFTFPA
jgi:hypothetical protein